MFAPRYLCYVSGEGESGVCVESLFAYYLSAALCVLQNNQGKFYYASGSQVSARVVGMLNMVSLCFLFEVYYYATKEDDRSKV